MAYGLSKNSPKRQPCDECGKWVKRVSQGESTVAYYCAKCRVRTIISLRA